MVHPVRGLFALIGSTFVSQAAAQSCSAGWTSRGVYCYKRGPNAVSYDEATLYCASENSWVGDIFSDGERDFCYTNADLAAGGEYRLWLGYNDIAVEGTFVNARNPGNPVCYNSWNPGEPNNWMDIEDCVVLGYNGIGFNDWPCSGYASYPLCKKLADPSTVEVLDCSLDAGFPPVVQSSDSPTADPSANPTADPSANPSAVPSANPTADPSANPTADPSVSPSAVPTFDALLLQAAAPKTSAVATSSLRKTKPYAYKVAFGEPIVQYRPNGSVSAQIGTVTVESYLGNNQFAITGGDGPCRQAGGKYRDGTLTVQCAAEENVVVDEVELCTYEVLWSSPSFCV